MHKTLIKQVLNQRTKLIERTILSVFISGILLIAGCVSQQSASCNKYKPGFKLQAGASKGGIIENTDLKQVPNTEVDAYSGATKTGFNAGAKVLFPVKRNAIESGIDYLYSNQTFTYTDNINGYNGKRTLGTSQFMIPVTYNFGIFRKKYEEGFLTIKPGYLIQFSYANITDGSGNLPEYKFSHFSKGLTIGLSTSPFHFSNGSKLGFFIDLYRGSRIYEDFYNQKDFEMPATSFLKYGISYQF